jgi:hypothetical protein
MPLKQQQNEFIHALENCETKTTLFTLPHHKAQKRLNIYRDSVHYSRIAALTKLFKCCKSMLGDDYWLQLLDQFIAAHSFSDLDSMASGAAFIAFLQQHVVVTQVPYLAELARLEWAWHKCFHQATAQKTESTLTEAIQQYGENLQLCLASQAQLLASAYPLYDLWLLAQQPDKYSVALTAKPQEYYFILYRDHDSITIEQLSINAWRICTLLQQQSQRLIVLCESYQEQYQMALDTTELTQLVKQNMIIWSHS